MITPDDIIPPDDSDESEMDDQQSQRDIHSNGLDEDYEGSPIDEDDPAMLKQAYDAADSAYTLDFDEEDEDDDYDD